MSAVLDPTPKPDPKPDPPKPDPIYSQSDLRFLRALGISGA